MGDGSPDGKYWFIGLEEATPLYNMENEKESEEFEKEINKRKGKKHNPVEEGYIQKEAKRLGPGFTKIYNIMSKIIKGIEGRTWEAYRNKHLLQKDSNEFHMNLFPVGKKEKKPKKKEFIKFEDFLRNKFDFQDYNQYENYVKETRFKCIKNFWSSFNPKKITICFGWRYKEDFITALGLQKGNEQTGGSDKHLLYYPNERVFITPFFGWGHMYDTRVNLLRKKIEEIKQ
jgi:hypothetical protein